MGFGQVSCVQPSRRPGCRRRSVVELFLSLSLLSSASLVTFLLSGQPPAQALAFGGAAGQGGRGMCWGDRAHRRGARAPCSPAALQQVRGSFLPRRPPRLLSPTSDGPQWERFSQLAASRQPSGTGCGPCPPPGPLCSHVPPDGGGGRAPEAPGLPPGPEGVSRLRAGPRRVPAAQGLWSELMQAGAAGGEFLASSSSSRIDCGVSRLTWASSGAPGGRWEGLGAAWSLQPGERTGGGCWVSSEEDRRGQTDRDRQTGRQSGGAGDSQDGSAGRRQGSRLPSPTPAPLVEAGRPPRTPGAL